MILIETVKELRAWRKSAGRVIFVPTMGALHDGHAALVREARHMAGTDAQVAASIFVNPLQFGPNEDFDRYPRTLEADLAICQAAGADMVFAPGVKEVYHADRSIQIRESSLSNVLCGASRPGHFDGVCTVVAKLFNLVQPDDAVFGKKDYQQLAIIRRLVRDLNFPVEIHGLETVREDDGLAMSSRNRYLSPAERAQAPALRAALVKARDAWQADVTGGCHLLHIIHQHLAEHATLGRKDYIALVDRHTLQPLDIVQNDGLIALAVFFDKARLIDNIELVR
ncbi:pantoate--beta-alanine ligase [Prosthecobacter fusiformis]|uniref:Pantothenate synthetase n=1 Tax=Prosthecobacter fusiformis TaxID=48464 RepID=A0A4R7RM74_9BACT|nr:pantoate--beta-alanine ligase [Prosthecobacter fusiformis]TDU66049.1 pantoate--beta-alanine ligase [Prosthecobacter fusiformis]